MAEPERQPYEPGQEHPRVYDQDNDGPSTRPNLQALEGGGQGDGVPSGNLKSLSDDDRKTKSPDDLNKSESGTNSKGEPTKNISDQVGRGFSVAGAAGGETALAARTVQRIVGSTKKHKKGLLIGGGVGGVLILLLGGFFAFIVQYELVHIEQSLVKYESEIEQHFQKKRASKLMQKMVCMQMKDGCPNDPEDDKLTDAEEAEAHANDETLTEEMDSFDLTDPAIKADLGKAGITVETDAATGDLTELKDSSGNNITDDIANSNTYFNEIEDALPQWDVGQLQSYRPLMVDQVDASFSGIPEDTTADGVDKSIEDTVTEGGSGNDQIAAAEENDDSTKPPASDTNTDSQQALNTSEEGELGDAINTVNQDLANGETDAQAEADAESAFKLDDPANKLLVAGLVSDACSVQSAAKKASGNRPSIILRELERHGNLLISMADQIRTGKMTGPIVNKVMQLFNGNSSATQTPNEPRPEESLSYNASAGYQRSIGGEVTGATPDMDGSVKPTADSGTQIVNEVDQVVDKIPGGNFTCKVSGSPFGFAIQLFGGAIQFVADDFSVGLTQIAFTGLIVGAQYELTHTVIPDIIKYFTPIGINGIEDSVQQINNSDAGLNASFSNLSRSQGALPVSNSTANSLTSEASKSVALQESEQSWTDRTFAISNPDSLVSHLADDLPPNLALAIQSMSNYLMSFPSTLFHNFSSIISGRALAATTPTNPGEPYGIAEYSFTDNEVNKYDAITNEQYLFKPVNIDVNGTTKSVVRIAALGNPNSYTPTSLPPNSDDSVTVGDPDNNDLLHCFVDSFVNIEEANPTPDTSLAPFQDPGADQNCGSLGMYDYNNNITVTNNTVNNLPGDSTAAAIYCQYAGITDPIALGVCINQTLPQLNDEVGHYRQYLLDSSIMKNYTSLTNSQ